MKLRIKEGVSLAGLSPQMVLAAHVVALVYQDKGVAECWITSGCDGVHMHNSLHYLGKALDFRTKNLGASLKPTIARDVQLALGAGFDVILESSGLPNEHLHVEWDPS